MRYSVKTDSPQMKRKRFILFIQVLLDDDIQIDLCLSQFIRIIEQGVQFYGLVLQNLDIVINFEVRFRFQNV